MPVKAKVDKVNLTVAEKFYIENNGTLSVEELAQNLGKSVDVVQSYCTQWNKEHPPKKEYRAKKLMSRPAKRGGVLVMTEEASMVGDDALTRYVSLEAINKAISEGNLELAKELKGRYDQQERGNKEIIRNKYTTMIHYIEKPDDDDNLGVENM